MTRKQFRHDMRRGLGSCHLELERCSDIEDYREDVLWGLQYATAYDAQCEGTRAIYLFEMIECFDDWSEFYAFVASGTKRSIRDRGWRFAHHAEVLALMAGSGYAPAQETVAALYDLLLHTLQAGRPSQNGIWSAADNFSRLCVATLTNGLQTQAEREAFFLHALTDYGKLIQSKPAIASRCEDAWFEFVAAETLGAERVEELLAGRKDDSDLARYLKNRERLQAVREAARKQRRQERTVTQTQEADAQLPVDEDEISALLSHYRCGDGARLIPLVKAVSLNEHRGNWHAVFSDVRKLIDHNEDADQEISAVLLPYMLREGYCSCCRLHVLELMKQRGLLTPECLNACRHDCSLDIRAFAEAAEAM